MPPLFSIVLVTCNRAGMLASAIKSVLWQTCGDFECFVVDDGSSDDTPSVFSRFSGDPRFHWHRFGDNKGYPRCRNHALRQATGRFVTFLDDDDIWLPEKLEAFKHAIESKPQTGFWFSNAYVLRFGRIVGELFDPKWTFPQGKVPGYYAVGLERLPYLTTNLAVSRDAFQATGLFREDLRILSDTEMAARLLASGAEVGVIGKSLSVRRLHEGQVTRQWTREYEEAIEALKAGRTPGGVFDAEKEKLVYEVAGYLWRSLQPAETRRFLLAELGERVRSSKLYRATYIPLPILRAARLLRRAYIRARYSSRWASGEFKEIYRLVQPMLESEPTPFS